MNIFFKVFLLWDIFFCSRLQREGYMCEHSFIFTELILIYKNIIFSSKDFFSQRLKFLCFRLVNYMFSNWSTLRLVLPFLTSLKVLYLSLPCRTFSLWMRSIVVSPVSSLVWAKSSFNDFSWLWRRSLRSARVSRSFMGSLMSSCGVN